MKQWEQIRRAHHVEGQSIREIARTTGLSRRTVRKMAAADELPQYRRWQERGAHKLGSDKERIQELLAPNKTPPRKLKLQWIKRCGVTALRPQKRDRFA